VGFVIRLLFTTSYVVAVYLKCAFYEIWYASSYSQKILDFSAVLSCCCIMWIGVVPMVMYRKTWVQFILRLVFKSGMSKTDAWLNGLCLVQAAPSVGQLTN
jgi:hypothetical protein